MAKDFPEAISVGYPSFSPDEQFVIFAVNFSNGSDLALVDIQSREITFMYDPEYMDIDPHISSDGRWILTRCDSTIPDRNSVLCLHDLKNDHRFYLVDE